VNLEEQLRDLMEYHPSTGTSISAEQVIRRVRRDRTRRAAIGACAAVLALGVGTVTVVDQGSAGHGVSATRQPTHSTTREHSPVLEVALNQQVTLTAGIHVWLTGQGFCTQTTSAFDGLPAATPQPAFCPQFALPGTTAKPGPQFIEPAGEADRALKRWFTFGVYTGPSIPDKITVTYYGAQTTATIVTSSALPGKFGYYVVLPYVQVRATATASDGRPIPSGVGTNESATAYDANGQVIADTIYP
jgi:hypothetical protein